MRDEWVQRQNEMKDDEEDTGPSLLDMQLRFAKFRVATNIMRIVLAILVSVGKRALCYYATTTTTTTTTTTSTVVLT